MLTARILQLAISLVVFSLMPLLALGCSGSPNATGTPSIGRCTDLAEPEPADLIKLAANWPYRKVAEAEYTSGGADSVHRSKLWRNALPGIRMYWPYEDGRVHR
ncbi:hypothetical protein K488DRAFT_69761 [Vararia minispora EC-137]|uniref:Uncharacterized protein n=1 Tax=Vararia minispora EC-137 TaxID=1314806 RepID=A0ACB8QNZ4_9AGAM|nr:hypothetical protein K488DRAFT_69761 [Vararia minispora EC-137]